MRANGLVEVKSFSGLMWAVQGLFRAVAAAEWRSYPVERPPRLQAAISMGLRHPCWCHSTKRREDPSHRLILGPRLRHPGRLSHGPYMRQERRDRSSQRWMGLGLPFLRLRRPASALPLLRVQPHAPMVWRANRAKPRAWAR